MWYIKCKRIREFASIGRKTEDEKHDDDDDSDSSGQNDENKESEGTPTEDNEGTLILDATCAPQNIRFPTDASLLNEAREKAEDTVLRQTKSLSWSRNTDAREPTRRSCSISADNDRNAVWRKRKNRIHS